MQEIIYLSELPKTNEMFAIVEDKNLNIIPSNYILERILKCFFNKLKDNDKQLAIKYLMQFYPNNGFLTQSKKLFDKPYSWTNLTKYFNDYGLKKNQKFYQQNVKLNMIRLDEDFHQLMELFEQKEFQENYYIPTSFHQYNYLIEKLKKHSFKLIDLIEQCQYSSFQLNSTILSHLVFFFFIPEELQINSREKMELYQLLGEITCECWLQFEYHIQQLKFTQQDQNKLKILSEIPQLFQIDLQTLKNSIYQILQMQ